MNNILSIDLESWVHFYREATARAGFGATSVERRELDDGYIPGITEKLLDLLDRYGQTATFFVLGELFEWYPGTIEEISARGHEVGYHTHSHRVLTSSRVLEDELERSRAFLERFEPIGFRAPRIFITGDSLDCLGRWNFRYSSSTYGHEGRSRFGELDEIPVTAICYRKRSAAGRRLPRHLSLGMLSRCLPLGSGLFVALLGAGVSRGIRRLNRDNRPSVLFIHPWQVDPPEAISGIRFRMRVLVANPLCFPYTRDIGGSLEKLLARHRFTSFEKCYYGQ